MDSTPQQPADQPQPEDDWLLSPTSATGQPTEQLIPTEVIGVAAPVRATDVTPRQGRSQLLGAGGLVAAGLVAGVVGTFALSHHGSSTTTFQPAGQNVQQSQGQQSQGQQSQGQQGFGGPMGGFGGPPGMTGTTGEEHVQGTVAGVSGSTLRVRTASGTTSYRISSSTQVVRNGQAAKLSDLKTGEPVLVHVITSNGSTTVERVIAGTMGGFLGGPPGAAQGSTING